MKNTKEILETYTDFMYWYSLLNKRGDTVGKYHDIKMICYQEIVGSNNYHSMPAKADFYYEKVLKNMHCEIYAKMMVFMRNDIIASRDKEIISLNSIIEELKEINFNQ